MRRTLPGQWYYFLPLVVSCLLLILPVHLRAQERRSSLAGVVQDATGAMLPGARVRLDPGAIPAVSNSQGEFFYPSVAPGTYTVSVSYAGFETLVSSVTLPAGQVTHLTAAMKLAKASENVTVTATAEQGPAEEINREITSPNDIDVLTNQQIMVLPNFTIADALGRMPGVTLERDEGDGKYVQVRGTEPRLTNTTIDGINVPSPESGVRQVKLDTVPADLVESVEVNKTLSANQDADGIGGSVNLVTRTAGDTPTISMLGEGGYTPIFDGRHASQYGVTLGKRFRGNKKLGVIGNFTYDYNGRGIDDIEPSNDVGTVTPSYDSIDLREYRYDRTRWGTAASVDYKLSEASNLYARGLYSDFKDYGDKWVYTLNDNVSPASTSTGDPATFSGANPVFSNSKRLPDYGIGTLALGGHHVYQNSWLAWEVSAARSRQTAAGGNPGTSFTWDINGSGDTDPTQPDYDSLAAFAANNCAYDPAINPSKYRPQWQPACTAKGSPVFDPTTWTLTELDLTQGITSQVNLQGNASYGFNYHLGKYFNTFEFGAKIRNGHKGQYAFSPALVGTGPTMDQFLSPLHNNHYYGGSYQMGPLVDYDQIVQWSNANPGVLVQDPELTALNGDAGNFDYNERITAGYLMNTIALGKFSLQTGLRLEATNFGGRGYQVITLANPPANDPSGFGGVTTVNESTSYLNILPSAQIRYAINGDAGVRFAYGRGMSRPDPQDIIPSISIDESKNPYQYDLGNPSLIAERANDFDLIYEQSLKPLGLFSVGAFYKHLIAPIITKTYIETAALAALTGAPPAGVQVSQPANAGGAWVDGFEVAFQQRMSWLPGFLGGTNFYGNYTWTNSEAFGVDPFRVGQNPHLLRQSPNAWNIGPGYDHGPLSMHLGLEYNAANINQYQYENVSLNSDGTTSPTPPVGGPFGPAGDNYFYSHMQTDAQISYRLKKGFELYASGQNLTNEVFGFYNGGPQYVNQREYYKPTYFGGLRWTSTVER